MLTHTYIYMLTHMLYITHMCVRLWKPRVLTWAALAPYLYATPMGPSLTQPPVGVTARVADDGCTRCPQGCQWGGGTA